MTLLCSWCNEPLSNSWVKVGNTWLHAHCIEEVALEAENYMKEKEDAEEVSDYLYSPRNNR